VAIERAQFSETNEPSRPMVPVDLILLDREAIGLIGKAGQLPCTLLGPFGQLPRRIDADDLHPPGFGQAVQQDEQGFHARGLYSGLGAAKELSEFSAVPPASLRRKP
jgi:hypothetical protein